MKIGIFTYHSQINYGGVLQAYALQQTLTEMGHQVFIVDRWLTENNRFLVGTFLESSFLGKCKRLLYAALLCGEEADMIRRQRTYKFIHENLNLTPYHFVEWNEAPKALQEFDCFIVGSDQVWNIQYPSNLFYLLERIKGIPKISYAASMGGTTKLSPENAKIFKRGLQSFNAISVREEIAKNIIYGLGFKVQHVVDPTLLASKEIWQKFSSRKDNRRRLFCYFMENNINEVSDILINYADTTDSHIDIFFNDMLQFAVNPFENENYVNKWWRLQSLKLSPKIHLHLDAGPAEFVRYASMASDALSDSYHALMFSIIFNLNVRILTPKSDFRIQMFSRIREYEKWLCSGTLIVDSIEQALVSIQTDSAVSFNDVYVEHRRRLSEEWLIGVLKKLLDNK